MWNRYSITAVMRAGLVVIGVLVVVVVMLGEVGEKGVALGLRVALE